MAVHQIIGITKCTFGFSQYSGMGMHGIEQTILQLRSKSEIPITVMFDRGVIDQYVTNDSRDGIEIHLPFDDFDRIYNLLQDALTTKKYKVKLTIVKPRKDVSDAVFDFTAV